MYEAFSRDDTGPRYVIMGDWPDASRGERYYMFEDIDLWVYRTKTGVPAAWRDIRKLPPSQRSTVPVLMLDGDEYGKEQSNVRRRLEEDGRGRVETPSTENNDGRETSDGGDGKSGNGVSPAAPDGRG
jgi:hypothetical protein